MKHFQEFSKFSLLVDPTWTPLGIVSRVTSHNSAVEIFTMGVNESIPHIVTLCWSIHRICLLIVFKMGNQ